MDDLLYFAYVQAVRVRVKSVGGRGGGNGVEERPSCWSVDGPRGGGSWGSHQRNG